MPTPQVILQPKNSEKHVLVPSPPEVPEPKESEHQVPVSAPVQVLNEEKAESAGPEVPQDHQESGNYIPAAPGGREEIEEVGGAPKEEEMPACMLKDTEEAAPDAGAPVPQVKEQPLPHD